MPVRRQSCMKCAKNGADDHGHGVGGERESIRSTIPTCIEITGTRDTVFSTFSCEFLFSNVGLLSHRTERCYFFLLKHPENSTIYSVTYFTDTNRTEIGQELQYGLNRCIFRIWKLRNGISNGANGISNGAIGISTAALFSLLVIQHQKIPRTS